MASSSFLTAFLLNFNEKSVALFHSRKSDLNDAVSTPSVTLSTAVADGRLFYKEGGGSKKGRVEVRRMADKKDQVEKCKELTAQMG